MLTEDGAHTLLTIINATKAIAVNAPVQWSIDWGTGHIATWSCFSVGQTDDGLPQMITIQTSADIPPTMIRAKGQVPQEHTWLALFENSVWTIGDLAGIDLTTFQLLEFTFPSMTTCERVRDRVRNETPDRYRAFCAAPHVYYDRCSSTLRPAAGRDVTAR